MKIKLPTFVLAALLFAGLPLASSNAYVGISVAIAPPAIPVYAQPYCPSPGYLWSPGYWAYSDFGYYWVPGVWVEPPRIGFLWTPGYWGYNNGLYLFNEGYWGPTVGFYGGINYGYGYGGRGYYGGRWAGNTFLYNTAVTRVNRNVITTTYVNREVVNNTGTRAGFNGPGGAKAKPTAQEQAAAKGQHIAPTGAQSSRAEAAKKDPALQARNNKGKPKSAAINDFHGKNGQQPATAGEGKPGKQAGARNRAGNAETATAARQSSEKAKSRAPRMTERPAAKANRATQTSSLRTNKPVQAKPTREVRKAASPRKPVQRVQPVQRHPQAVRGPQQVRKAPQPTRVRQAAPAPRGRGPAQAPQDAKKKKRKPNG